MPTSWERGPLRPRCNERELLLFSTTKLSLERYAHAVPCEYRCSLKGSS